LVEFLFILYLIVFINYNFLFQKLFVEIWANNNSTTKQTNRQTENKETNTQRNKQTDWQTNPDEISIKIFWKQRCSFFSLTFSRSFFRQTKFLLKKCRIVISNNVLIFLIEICNLLLIQHFLLFFLVTKLLDLKVNRKQFSALFCFISK